MHNRLAGVIIDRFGKDVMMIPADEEHFHSPRGRGGERPVHQLGLLPGRRGEDPGDRSRVVEQVNREISRLMEQYGISGQP